MNLNRKLSNDMNTLRRGRRSNSLKPGLIAACGGFLLVLSFATPCSAQDTEMGQAFATPQAAASALALAANSRDSADLRNIFGPAASDLQNPDRVEATNEMSTFAAAYKADNQLVRQSETNYELDVGTNAWPFPIPIVKKDGSWYFDTEAGKEELLNRRIGRDELDALKSVRAYVDAQRDYASMDRNDDDVLQYAQRLISTPGHKDGLYWPSDVDNDPSPLGPLVADAQGEGYNVEVKGQEATRTPFHGYYFKILTSQGSHAAGGQYSYIINGRMIAGFALIAWPAEYGNSGVMTFIVNQRGRVYQRDLGADTETLAPAISAYDPGPGWSVSPD